MELLGFSASQVHPLASLAEAGGFLGGNAAGLFVWADCCTEEVTAEGLASEQAGTGAGEEFENTLSTNGQASQKLGIEIRWTLNREFAICHLDWLHADDVGLAALHDFGFAFEGV